MTHRGFRATALLSSALALAVTASQGAQAAGFFIQEQNAAGVGRAQAGNVVAADDASTIFFNPAGMALLNGNQFTVGADLIIPNAGLTDKGSTTRSTGAYLANTASGGFSTPRGGNGGNPGSATPVPDMYVSVPIQGTPFTVGLGITSPFGFVSKYSLDSFARYDSVESLLQTADIAPTVAWKINDVLSLGVGLDEQYVHVKLVTALPNALAPGGPTAATDGAIKLGGVNWSTGFNAGLIFMPTPDTKLGVTYRSAITHDVQGRVTFAGLTGPLAARNGTLAADAKLNLPDMITAGVSQKITPNLTLLGEVDYFGWSKFKEIRIHLSDNSADLVTTENYRNTWSASAGAEYQLTPQLKLRGGVKVDQTPTINGFRDTRVPDGNRTWVSAGLNYKLAENVGVDVGYSHIFLKSEPIDVTRPFYETAPFPIPTQARVVAQSDVKLDILSVGLNFRF
jgi:long-chain fatty acid transport protein